MSEYNPIKQKLLFLFNSNPVIHIKLITNSLRTLSAEHTARITGVYRNIFQVEINGKKHTFRYSDVAIGHVVIAEYSENRL